MILFEFNKFIKYLLLGLIQGLTEPLTISSSGHLVIFDEILHLSINDINFLIIVNFGSLIAILLYYRKFLMELLSGIWKYLFKKESQYKKDFMYGVYVIIACIPSGIVGIIFKDQIDATFNKILPVAINLFITGMLLLFIQYKAKQATTDQITLKTSLFMGFAQIFGILPGISRSGSTSAFGVINKTSLEKVLRFSFMMYIPVSIGSLFLGISDLETQNVFLIGYLGAFIVSIIGTYLAITFFFKLVKKDNLKYFGYYCLGVSMAVLMYLAWTK